MGGWLRRPGLNAPFEVDATDAVDERKEGNNTRKARIERWRSVVDRRESFADLTSAGGRR